MKQYFKTTDTAEVDNYPYGRLRAKVTFGLEHKPKKGFRTSFQSVDPKTGRINKPKHSTYYPVILMYKDTESGHIKYDHFGFNGEEEINRSTPFLAEHFDLFTPEQLTDIYATILMYLKVNIQATATYRGAKIDDLLPLHKPAIDAAIKGFKSNGTENTFADIKLDSVAIKATEVEGFNPFVTTSYIIDGNGMRQVPNETVQ